MMTRRQSPGTKGKSWYRCTRTSLWAFRDADLESVSINREANIDSIRVLDEQIIKLKRIRNSLSRISTRIPPEILGHIFAWTLARDPGGSLFSGFQKGSYNFLLVCHHWFEVASRTPEVWSFWGNTLEEWKKRHHRSRTSPLDLVLDQRGPDARFDESLQSAVRARVIQGIVRQVHLRSDNSETMASITSSLTPGDDDSAQNANIESIVWQNTGTPFVDISNFFVRSNLPRLHLLDLFGNFRISSWDNLVSRTTLLTTLSLRISQSSSPTPTMSQLFSILASNPNLQQLALSDAAIPSDANGSALKVSLQNLKLLYLKGDFGFLFGLLCQLVLPEALDSMHLTVFYPTQEDVSQSLGSYMQDHFRRDARFRGRLYLSSEASPGSILISVGAVWDRFAASAPTPPDVTVWVVLPRTETMDQLFIGLIAPIPGENVVAFDFDSGMELPEEVFFMMPNIQTLDLIRAELSEGFLRPNPDGPRANMKLFPSLQSLRLESFTLNNGDWGHLTRYLVHQTSDNQIISLEVAGDSPDMDPEVVGEVEDLVDEFVITPLSFSIY